LRIAARGPNFTVVNVKAQGLLNAVKWIEEEYGESALRDIVRQCSPEVRERYVSAIGINWHPVSELLELLEVADRMLGTGDGTVAESIGAAGARANMKGLAMRVAFYVANPEYMSKRIAGIWHQYNDEDAMHVISVAEERLVLELRGITSPERLFCSTLTGWGREIAVALGVKGAVSKHVDCRARGDARCVWEVSGSTGEILGRAPSSGRVKPARE
jgi:hypothetical protein